MRNFFILLLYITLSANVFGQQKAPGLPEVENLQDFYRSGVGLRVGWPIAAITFKHFILRRTAVEIVAAPQFGGASFTVLIEKHIATPRSGLYWYYGVGADAGLFQGNKFKDYEGNYYEQDDLVSIALDAVIGIEKNIHETPFSIGFDIKPHIGIHNAGGSVVEGAVTFKYIWSW